MTPPTAAQRALWESRPDLFRSMTEEEYAAYEPITEEQIREALAEGKRARDAYLESERGGGLEFPRRYRAISQQGAGAMSKRMTDDELAEVEEFIAFWSKALAGEGGVAPAFPRAGEVQRLRKLVDELQAVRNERDEARAMIKVGWDIQKPLKPHTQWDVAELKPKGPR